MSSRIAAELSELAPAPYALFGHSLGALVAYETAITLRDRGTPPLCLLVSGSLPPRYAGSGKTHLATDRELWSAVRQLGGIDPELADDDEVAEMLLPALRADISVHESYRPRPGIVSLSCPVYCYYGTGDPLLDEARLSEWAEISTGDFTLQARPGAHFHLFEDTGSLIEDVLAAMENALCKRRPRSGIRRPAPHN